MKPPSSPAIDFLKQAQGKLPEAISPSDLPTVNFALEILFADLRGASKLFNANADNGQLGAAIALGAVWRFIALFEKPLGEGLHVPFLRLQDALGGLQNNNVAPLLKPVPRSGRAGSSDARSALMGAAAGAVQRLQDSGIGVRKAYQMVAAQLKKLGVKPERGHGDVTADTVRHWCEAVSADVGRAGAAATTYDSMFTPDETARFGALPKDRAPKSALESLAAFVRGIFPEIAPDKKPLNPPS
jgi:hypothetical protein